MSLGQRLKKLRTEHQLSQKQVAERIGVSPSTYRDWEQGKSISGEPYNRIAELFQVSLNYLMYEQSSTTTDSLIENLELAKNAISRCISTTISLK